MGNYTYKKRKAEEFNDSRQYRLEKEELERLDKLRNPEKHKLNNRTSRRVSAILALAAGLGINCYSNYDGDKNGN